ncbi:MAG: Holliday junction resolvase RuvX [Chloroflexota bacterium]
MKVLAIDPGETNIGVAISDPSGTIANPLTVIKHVSRPIDAATIAQVAEEHAVALIIVGQALDDESLPTFEGRRSARLAAAIRTQTNIRVQLWDESNSTQTARIARLAMGGRTRLRRQRRGHLDDLAATVILQTYLDSCPSEI